MKKSFDELSRQVSRLTTRKYSTSFSLGIMALSPAIRPAIYAIYGYVRLADEIVDSFHGHDRRGLLERLKAETGKALEEGISLNPILNSFQETVIRYQIDLQLIDQFHHSMEMDLQKIEYDVQQYNTYIFGSAEVVGLMCLRVFVEGDDENFRELKPYAMKLGSAFQKVNFLRDMKDDHEILGRSYFPGIDLSQFNNSTKCFIEQDIEAEFGEALKGILRLPGNARFGVYLAYRYYLSLFRKIQKLPAQQVMNRRIRIPDTEKISLMMSSYVQYRFSLL